MNTRKPEREPKPTSSPLIEWPTKEELELPPMTVEHKEPAPDGEAWHVETEH